MINFIITIQNWKLILFYWTRKNRDILKIHKEYAFQVSTENYSFSRYFSFIDNITLTEVKISLQSQNIAIFSQHYNQCISEAYCLN